MVESSTWLLNSHNYSENCTKTKNIYTFFEWAGGLHGSPYILCLLIIKMEKVQEYDKYWNQILHHFDSIFLPQWKKNNCNNKQIIAHPFPRSNYFRKWIG